MSKSHAHDKRRRGGDHRPERARTPDRAIYIGLTMIGAFIVLLAVPLTGGKHWQEVAVGYVAAMAWLVNLYAIRACLGGHLANWQAALARLPLRCAGYGRKGGKPLEAAPGHAAARNAIIASIVFSIVVVVALAWWLVPELRP